MAMQIAVKLDNGGYTKIKTPYVKLSSTNWVKAQKVYAKVNATTWAEVWPGIYFYTHVGLGYNMSIYNAFGSPTAPATYLFTNNGTIGSNSVDVAALVVGAFPAGSKVILVNNGRIQGMGGAGGEFNGDQTEIPAGAGGPALDCDWGVEIQNNAQIWGGGGGGGAAGEWGGSNDNSAPGGAGAGNQPGIANRGAWRPGYYYPADAASDTAGGVNPSWLGHGAGGGPGEPGQAFTTGIGSSTNLQLPPAGAGAAIRYTGNASITVWGDIRGPRT